MRTVLRLPTAQQERILAYIRDCYRHDQRPPTMREIQAGCEISNISVVFYNLHRLADKGLIEMGDGAARSVRLPVRPGEPCPYCGRVE